MAVPCRRLSVEGDGGRCAPSEDASPRATKPRWRRPPRFFQPPSTRAASPPSSLRPFYLVLPPLRMAESPASPPATRGEPSNSSLTLRLSLQSPFFRTDVVRDPATDKLAMVSRGTRPSSRAQVDAISPTSRSVLPELRLIAYVHSRSVPQVLRTYAEDQENPPAPPPPGSQPHPLDRMLAPGELGVSFMFNPPGAEPDSHLQIRQTSTLDLVDRLMQPGDVCKRSLEDVQSGAIKSVHMDTKLEHVISGQKLEAWVPSEDLVGALKVGPHFLWVEGAHDRKPAADRPHFSFTRRRTHAPCLQVEVGDRVINSDWIGIVEVSVVNRYTNSRRLC